jgi:hypothetical protein
MFAHPQSIRPNEIVSSAVANYYLDLRRLPDYVCDITRRDTRGTTVRWQELIVGGKLYVWSYIPQLDGSWKLETIPIAIDLKEAPWVDRSYLGRLLAPAFSFRDMSNLLRPQTVREDQLDNRNVWVVELKARSYVKWPTDLPHFYTAQMWIDQQSRRMLRLVLTGVGKRAEYVFRTPLPQQSAAPDDYASSPACRVCGGQVRHPKGSRRRRQIPLWRT